MSLYPTFYLSAGAVIPNPLMSNGVRDVIARFAKGRDFNAIPIPPLVVGNFDVITGRYADERVKSNRPSLYDLLVCVDQFVGVRIDVIHGEFSFVLDTLLDGAFSGGREYIMLPSDTADSNRLRYEEDTSGATPRAVENIDLAIAERRWLPYFSAITTKHWYDRADLFLQFIGLHIPRDSFICAVVKEWS